MVDRKTPTKPRTTKAVDPRKSELQTVKEELDRLMPDTGPVSQDRANRVAELNILRRKLERI